MLRWIGTFLLALAAGFAGAGLWDMTGMGERYTREYLLANPEILPEAIEVLQQRETLARLEPMRRDVETPFPGAVMGNPNGTITLVEFSDYACTYCRQSLADVASLIAEHPDLKVVVREYPILTPASADAARMALAAARQGKYAAFHDAMFRLGPPTETSIAAAAKEAGLDLAQAQADIGSGAFEPHLQANAAMASGLSLSGTPGWVIGDQVLNGAVGIGKLGEAVREARES